MDVEKTVALASRGYSLDGVPLETTTFRKLLAEIKKASAAPTALKDALSHLGRRADGERSSEDKQNDAAAVVFYSMAKTPELRLSLAEREYLMTVAGLGGQLLPDVQAPLDGLARGDYLPFINLTWKGGPSLSKIKTWAASKGKTIQPAGPRLEKAGDEAKTTLIRFSRPAEERRRRGESELPSGEYATRDLIDVFWISEKLKANDLEREIAGVLDEESVAWGERQSRLILEKINGYFAWPAERQKEEWIALLDRIDVAVQTKLKRTKKPTLEAPEVDELDILIKKLGNVIMDYYPRESGIYVAEETLCRLGLRPQLLLKIDTGFIVDITV